MKHKAKNIVVVSLIVAVLTSCGQRARVTGQVHDGFDHPLEGVEVSIPRTTFKAATGSDGSYNLPFAPGSFEITFTKPGYSVFTVPQNVAVETSVPLELVTLYKIPPQPGVMLVGGSDYIPIKAGKLGHADVPAAGFFLIQEFHAEGTIDVLPKREVYKFIEARVPPLTLLAMGEGSIARPNGEIISRYAILGTRRPGPFGLGVLAGTFVNEVPKKTLAEGLTMREFRLGSGKYAFARICEPQPPLTLESERCSGSIIDPIFPFEIGK